ncbi:hypothetical protein V5O48_014862 [Marasmius crinis-equi]|uniref:Sugar transporter n=1 Tax=Marasmius crinis-equi TaxID=585013 RepID=A0ABR3EW47_9AGAR
MLLQIRVVFMLWGCAMQAGASNIGIMIAGQIIAGLSIGCVRFLFFLNPLINDTDWQCAFDDGSAVQCRPLIEGSRVHKKTKGLQLVLAGLLLIGIQFLPNSTRWLLEVGRNDEARAAVHRSHGGPSAEVQERAETQYREMYDTIKAEMPVRSNKISDLWATWAMVKRSFVGCGLQIFCQLTGASIINYVGPRMRRSLGNTGGKDLLIQGIYGAVEPIANLSFVVLFSVVAAILATNPVEEGATDAANPAAQRAGIAVIFMTSIIFSLSFGPVSWVLAFEVFPTSVEQVSPLAQTGCLTFNTLRKQSVSARP